MGGQVEGGGGEGIAVQPFPAVEADDGRQEFDLFRRKLAVRPVHLSVNVQRVHEKHRIDPLPCSRAAAPLPLCSFPPIKNHSVHGSVTV